MKSSRLRRWVCLALACWLAVFAATAGLAEAWEDDFPVETEEISADLGAPDQEEAEEEAASGAVENAVAEAEPLSLGEDGIAGDADEQPLTPPDYASETTDGEDNGDAVFVNDGSGIAIDSNTFPDANFRDFVKSACDLDGDGALSPEEIEAVTTLSVDKMNIYSLRGIGVFTALTNLSCARNNLTELELSGNGKLVTLDCSDNQLKTLTLGDNPLLEKLIVSGNDVSDLDLSRTTWLTAVDISNTGIRTLDISECEGLKAMVSSAYARTYDAATYGYYVDADHYIRLDQGALLYPLAVNSENFPDERFRAWVSANCDPDGDGWLTQAESDTVTSADFSYPASGEAIGDLKGIEHFSRLTTLNCAGNALTKLDLVANTRLETLYCGDNQLTALNLGACTGLTALHCENNALTALDISALTALRDLDCHGNRLTALSVSSNTRLQSLMCGNNRLTSLDLANCRDLTRMGCAGNSIVRLNLSSATVLMRIYNTAYRTETAEYCEYVDGSSLLQFDLRVQVMPVVISADTFPDSRFRAWVLDNIDADSSGALSDDELNAVTSLDLSYKGIQDLTGVEYFSNLVSLDCSGNVLTSLRLAGNTKLTALDCSNNDALASLDVSANTALTTLNCASCALRTLSLSRNSLLTSLVCSDNELYSLDLTHNPLLLSVHCEDNNLTALSLSGLDALQFLYCQNNSLTAMNLNQTPNLTGLECHGNLITSLTLYQCPLLLALYDPNNLVQSTLYYAYRDALGGTLTFDLNVYAYAMPEFKLYSNDSYDAEVGQPFMIVLKDGVYAKKFSSANRKVARVDDLTGIVTPTGEGSTKITVKTTSDAKLTLKLKVKDPTMPTRIELEYSGTITLDLNDTILLDYTLEPEGTAESEIRWSSSSSAVAKVDDEGVVTPRKVGTTTITAQTKRGNKKDTVKIKVVDGQEPTRIELSESGTITQFMQEPLQLDYTLYPEDAESEVKWSSSATRIAKVDDEGLVTFRKAGTVIITAKTKKGNKTAKVKIKVEDGAEPESITIEEGPSVSMSVGEVLELTATMESKGEYEPESKLKWSSNKKKVATVDRDGVVTAKKSGTAKVTVQTENNKKDTIYIYVD